MVKKLKTKPKVKRTWKGTQFNLVTTKNGGLKTKSVKKVKRKL